MVAQISEVQHDSGEAIRLSPHPFRVLVGNEEKVVLELCSSYLLNDQEKYDYIGKQVTWMQEQTDAGKWPTKVVHGYSYVTWKPEMICPDGYVLADRLQRTFSECIEDAYTIMWEEDTARPNRAMRVRHRLMLGEIMLENYDFKSWIKRDGKL